jgi:CspA family cold shock protein
MSTGTLKMWKTVRGFGFIQNDAGGPDVFLHITALKNAGIDPDSMKNGEPLTFDIVGTREGRAQASNVRRPG